MSEATVTESVTESQEEEATVPESTETSVEEEATFEDLLEEYDFSEEELTVLNFAKGRADAAYDKHAEAAGVINAAKDVAKSAGEKWDKPAEGTSTFELRKKYDDLIAEAEKTRLQEEAKSTVDETAVKNAENAAEVAKTEFNSAISFTEGILKQRGDFSLSDYLPALTKISGVTSASKTGIKRTRVESIYVDDMTTPITSKNADGKDVSTFTSLRLWLKKETGKDYKIEEIKDMWKAAAGTDNVDAIKTSVDFYVPRKDKGNYRVIVNPVVK
jgi:hypothetical protein